jgi:hypothetical protein
MYLSAAGALLLVPDLTAEERTAVATARDAVRTGMDLRERLAAEQDERAEALL